jgi:hypothetical protein
MLNYALIVVMNALLMTPAQPDHATVVGTVIDMNGAVIATAEVEVYSEKKKLVVRTDEIGSYRATVRADAYWVNVRSNGFGSVRRSWFEVQPGEVIVFNFQLEVCPSHGGVFSWRAFEVLAPPGGF